MLVNSPDNQAIAVVAECLLGNWPMAETVVSRLKAANLYGVNDQMIDYGAQALRKLEQGHKRLNPWSSVPASTKKRWRTKAEAVLRAAVETPF